METLWNEQDRQKLVQRIGSLRPNAKALWGKMGPGMMLEHLAIALRVAIGEMPAKPKRGPFRFAPLRKLIIYVAPWPKGAPTAPEYIVTEDGDFASRRANLKKLIDKCCAYPRDKFAEHPAFGKLNEREWGRLHWRHIDHHLRQFGD